MAGNTGKMTAEALAIRGPRMVLARVYRNECHMLIIFREGQEPFPSHGIGVLARSGGVLAKSYSLSYLRRVGKGNS